MADTTFTSGTVIASSWLNDVNDATYNGTGVFTPTGTGAVARTNQAKLRETVSVLDFGAVADSNGTAGNGTDNTAAFTAAILHAVTNRCTLLIPSGNGLMYRHTGPLPVLVASLASGVRKGVIIEGDGPGSIIFNDSTGDSFVLDSTAGAADMGTQIKIRNLSFVSNTGTRPTSFVRNKKGINTEVSGCHFMSVFMASGGGCVINEVAYGLRYINNIHRGVVGDALVLRNALPETSGYSYVATVERCDFSFCTRGIYAEGTNCLNVRDCVFGENTDSGIVVDPTVNGVFGFNIDIATTWFEKNVNYDIDLRSTASNWCEAAIRHCQFGGFSPTFLGHINLGAKSRVFVLGTPTGNTVQVSGNTVASFYGIGTVPKFIQSGSFYWNEYDYAGGYNTPSLDISSTGDIIANTGGFISSKGTTAVPNAVATTLFTMPSSANGVYLLTTTAGTSGPAAWTVVAIISCSASLGQLTVLQTSTNLTITRSGLNIQGTQSTGGSVNVSWAVTRLLA